MIREWGVYFVIFIRKNGFSMTVEISKSIFYFPFFIQIATLYLFKPNWIGHTKGVAAVSEYLLLD